MVNHVRNQVREAAAALLTGLATTGPHVFQSRVYPLQDEELPCLLISTEGELVGYMTMGFPRRQNRTITLSVKALSKTVLDLDDVLDAICKEVEVALLTPTSLPGLAKDIQLKSTAIGLHGEGERPIGVAVMSFEVTVHTRENAPDVAI